VVFAKQGESFVSSELEEWRTLVSRATSTPALRESLHIHRVFFVSTTLEAPMFLGDAFDTTSSSLPSSATAASASDSLVPSNNSGQSVVNSVEDTQAEVVMLTDPAAITPGFASKADAFIIASSSSASSSSTTSGDGDIHHHNTQQQLAIASSLLHSQLTNHDLHVRLYLVIEPANPPPSPPPTESPASRHLKFLQIIVRQLWRLSWLRSNPVDSHKQILLKAGSSGSSQSSSPATVFVPLHLQSVLDMLDLLHVAVVPIQGTTDSVASPAAVSTPSPGSSLREFATPPVQQR
jgi:hypothetical protein